MIRLIIISVLVSCCQHVYSQTNPSAYSSQNHFVGCITYKIFFEISDKGKEHSKTETLLSLSKENYGTKKRECYDINGNVLIEYSDSSHVDKIWYFVEENTEYTLFKLGAFRYENMDKRYPAGYPDNKLNKVVSLKAKKVLLGRTLFGYIARYNDGDENTYWVSSDLSMNQVTYRNKRFAYYDQIMGTIKGVPLAYTSSHVGLFYRHEQAIDISLKSPPSQLFELPNKTPIPWD